MPSESKESMDIPLELSSGLLETPNAFAICSHEEVSKLNVASNARVKIWSRFIQSPYSSSCSIGFSMSLLNIIKSLILREKIEFNSVLFEDSLTTGTSKV